MHLGPERLELKVDSKIEIADGLLQGSHQGCQREGRANDQTVSRLRLFHLRDGKYGEWKVVLMHVLKFVVAGDANNFIERARLAGSFVKPKPFAEGILAVEDFSRKRLIDDSHFRGSCSIAVIEVAA